jgi:hypothetical protein
MAFQQSLQVRATPGAARNLAAVLLMNGDPVQAAAVYRLAMQIDPGDLQNQRALAWLLATHPDSRVRNGREAVELSRQIVIATNGQVPVFLLTLCASLAESGDFDQAAEVAAEESAATFKAEMRDPIKSTQYMQRENDRFIDSNPWLTQEQKDAQKSKNAAYYQGFIDRANARRGTP